MWTEDKDPTDQTLTFLAGAAAFLAGAAAFLAGAAAGFLPPKFRNMVVVEWEEAVAGATAFLGMKPPMKAEAEPAARAKVTREVFIFIVIGLW